MDKTGREIKKAEEISTGIVEDYLELLKPFVQQIDRLNTRIKELEAKLNTAMVLKIAQWEAIKQGEAKVKELEKEIEKQKDKTEEVANTIVGNYEFRLQRLLDKTSILKVRIKELERVAEDDERIKQLEKEKDEIPV